LLKGDSSSDLGVTTEDCDSFDHFDGIGDVLFDFRVFRSDLRRMKVFWIVKSKQRAKFM